MIWLQKLRYRFRALSSKRKLDAEMAEEMRSHIEMRTQQNIEAGMPPEKARLMAERQFGWVESIKETCRDQRGVAWIENLCKEFRLAFRQLRQNPGFAFVSITSLSIALALSASTLAIANAYLLKSFPYPSASRIYHLMYAPPGPYEPRGMNAIDWKRLEDVVEDAITASGITYYLRDQGALKRVSGFQTSSGFIRGLGIQPSAGRSFVEEEFQIGSESVAMISHDLWRSQYGSDPRTIGSTLQVIRENEQPESLRIVGVLPPGFWFGRDSNTRVDLLIPLRFHRQAYMVRLREGVPVPFAEQRITEAAKMVGSDFRPGWKGAQLESVHERYVKEIRPIIVGITIAVGVLLVMVCANVAVLLLLRTMRRQKEMAVRVALGARLKHIITAFAIEAALLSGASLVFGLALTGIALRLLTPFIEAQFGKPAPAGPSTIQMDPTVLLALGGISFLIALLLGLIPSLTPWYRRLMDTLRSSGMTATDSMAMRRLRWSLVALEVGGSFALLMACGLMVRSVLNLATTNLGFDPEKIVRVGVRLPAQRAENPSSLGQFFSALTEQLPQGAGSQITLMTAFPPFYPANKYQFEAHEAQVDGVSAGMLRVGAGYFKVYNVPIEAGREFTTADSVGSEPVALISQTLARQLWPDLPALGRQLRVVEGDQPDSPLGPWRRIIGIVGDIRQGYSDTDLRDIYLPFMQAPTRFASVHIRTELPLLFWEENIRAAAAALDPLSYVSPATTIISEDRQRSGMQFVASMLSSFALFAAILAILGLYGVTSYSVQQREREIAIRAALGGSRARIVRLFLKQGAFVLTIGLTLGLFGAFGAAKILKNQIYGIQPFDFLTLVISGALMITGGLASIWWPARRASARSPMTALKEG